MNQSGKSSRLSNVSPYKQKGLSLIELLVAMFIGLFLLVGITTSYLSSKKTSIQRDHLSILEDNGRIALEVLSDTLKHTGYRSTNVVGLDSKFIFDRPDVESCGTGEQNIRNPNIFPAAPNLSTENGGGDDPDSIGVVYLGDASLSTDCTGQPLQVACQVGSPVSLDASKIFNTFFVEDEELKCSGSRSLESQPIAEGVENMQILYGIDVDGDDDRTVDRYVNAADVGGLWESVVSIQVAILVRTLIDVKDAPESEIFTLLDKEIPSKNDRFQRAVFSTTINLRN